MINIIKKTDKFIVTQNDMGVNQKIMLEDIASFISKLCAVSELEIGTVDARKGECLTSIKEKKYD